jgi:hypothetical protein
MVGCLNRINRRREKRSSKLVKIMVRKERKEGSWAIDGQGTL